MNIRDEISERDKLIQFLREEYVRAAGHDINIPFQWEKIAGPPIALAENIESLVKEQTFLDAVRSLDLPKLTKEDKFGGPKKKALNQSQAQLASKVSLCGYAGKNLTKENFGNFVTGVKRLPNLNIIELSGNGLSDTFQIELEELLLCKKIKRINLSNNDLGRAFTSKFVDILKAEDSHYEWIDVSSNPLSADSTAIINFSQALRKHPNLYHFSISVEGNSSEYIARAVVANKIITSVALPHSKLTENCIETLCTGLSSKRQVSNISALNFSHCFLGARQMLLLADMLKHNRTLVKLDLSYNGLISNVARYLADSLRFNSSLHILYLQYNDLDDIFCENLAESLKRNSTLFECDLSGNPFTERGANRLIEIMGSYNHTISTFGLLDTNEHLGVNVREQLKNNTGFNRGNYVLLKPIEETNPYGYIEELPWNLNDAAHF
ncbi:unnamed protein product [Blepharisma stoltei]|uniref:Uncharacterized protein n=1 Tax=Blepharisma stoltei TaxID=1481888 RepID=A0AAU9JFT5_9CILI|nr:unnamed protein product [Blepharisma stoltei]